MSTKDEDTRPAPRALRDEESRLLRAALSKVNVSPTPSVTSETQVVDMQDGGMGSIRFLHSVQRHFGKEVARAEYRDSDGVLVSIALNVDECGDLFEMDFWKVNFAKLIRYPHPEDLTFSEPE